MNVFKTACAEVLEYLRRAVTPFFIKLMFGMTMLAVLLITNDVLRTILTAVLFAGDIVLTYVLLRSSGETACKMKEAGRLLRENKPVGSAEHAGGYKPCKEYAPYKGFVIGAVVSLPAIVLIVVGALTGSAGTLSKNTLGILQPESMRRSVASYTLSATNAWISAGESELGSTKPL